MHDQETECEIVWVKVEIASCKTLYIAAYYRPNATDGDSLDQSAKSLEKVPPAPNAHIWLAGDMNLSGIAWPTTDINPTCPSPAQHNQFLDIIADKGMSQVIGQPTCANNTLDRN